MGKVRPTLTTVRLVVHLYAAGMMGVVPHVIQSDAQRHTPDLRIDLAVTPDCVGDGWEHGKCRTVKPLAVPMMLNVYEQAKLRPHKLYLCMRATGQHHCS